MLVYLQEMFAKQVQPLRGLAGLESIVFGFYLTIFVFSRPSDEEDLEGDKEC